MRTSSLLLIMVVFPFFIPVFGQSGKQITTFDQLNDFLSKNPTVKEIYIKNGVYKDVNLVLTRLHGIKIAAEIPGEVKLVGKTAINIKNSDGFSFSGFHFQQTWSQYLLKLESISNSIIEENFFDRCEGNAYSRIIGLQGGSKHNTIRNNTFDGIHTMGITISRDENYHNTISKNVFLNIPSVKEVHPESKDGNGMEVVSIGTVAVWDDDMEKRDFHTIVSDNYFENIKGDMNEIICVKANRNVIERNYFTNNSGGVSLRYGNNNIVRENVFVKNGQNIIVWGKNHLISNNIIYQDKIGIQLPSSNFRNRTKNYRAKKAGYFQVENIRITDNFVSTQDNNPLYIGRHRSRERNLLPKNIIIENNNFTGIANDDLVSNKHISQIRRSTIRMNSFMSDDVKVKDRIRKANYYFGKSW